MIRLNVLQTLMLLAAALRQQGDALVVRCCEAATEEISDYAAASKLYQRASGIYAYVDHTLLALEEASEGSK